MVMAMRAKMKEAKNLAMAIVATLDLARMFEEKRKILMEEMVDLVEMNVGYL